MVEANRRSSEGGDPAPACILVADSQKAVREGFEKILSGAGFRVKTAGDAGEALAKLGNPLPDLIFADVSLKDRSGMDLIGQVRGSGLLSPVVLMAETPDMETSRLAVRLGAFDFIPKSIPEKALIRIAGHGVQHNTLLVHKAKLEKENLRVRRNMEAIFRSLKDGIMTVDAGFRVIEANDRVREICRHAGQDLVGKDLSRIRTECSSACFKVLKQTLETGESMADVRIECRHPQRPGQTLLLTATPLRHDNPKKNGAVLVVRDITELTRLERQLHERHSFQRIIGKSRPMQEVFTLLENIAASDSSVLITGETGTGKELVANAIHYNSLRKDRPFVKVNCSALAETLLDSELFGHVAGAFTGAVKARTGRFALADGGTLFLDEIGDISPLIQIKLRRVLQEREFERVGDSRPVKVDVRLVAATNRILRDKVRTGEFREDLYYRIKVVALPMPSLARRREDIPLLADHFLDQFNQRFKRQIKGFSGEVMAAFMAYPWPGNIRELEHAIEHGFVLCQGPTLRVEHLPSELRRYKGIAAMPEGNPQITRDMLLNALNRAGGNKAKAARFLGIGRRTLYRKLDHFQIASP